jgi:hypothetical protein
MTSAEAIQQAKDSMSDADLKKFRVTREQWNDCVDWLAEGHGIYPDADPRNKGKYEEHN